MKNYNFTKTVITLLSLFPFVSQAEVCLNATCRDLIQKREAMFLSHSNQHQQRLNQLSNMKIDEIADKQIIEVYEILSKSQERAVQASAIQLLSHWQNELAGAPIITPTRATEFKTEQNHRFQLFALDTFTVKDRGTFVSGMVFQGSIKVGDKLILQKADGRDLVTRCLSLETINLPEVQAGAFIVMQLENLTEQDIQQGDALIII